ncbi:MAG: transcription initiation factor IIB family protein [Euryarchaeota archaeon]|nr:transcription initiation factor IIB family protein [Euryarchaeota archaeon]
MSEPNTPRRNAKKKQQQNESPKEERSVNSQAIGDHNPSRNFGSTRPSRQSAKTPSVDTPRRTVGNIQPCEDCGLIAWEEDTSRGEVVCGGCGLVVEDSMIDPGAEWTNYEGPDRSRVGAPTTPTLSDKGLNTTIDRRDLTAGRAIRNGMNARARRDWRRRSIIDDRSKTRKSRDRNLAKAMTVLRDKGDLPGSLLDEAAVYYRKAVEAGVVTGRSIAGIAGACAYLAARERGLPRSIEAVAESFMVNEKEMKRNIRLVSRVLGTHRISHPGEYIGKFCNNLGLPPAVEGEAQYLWEKVSPANEWQGKKPAGVAGVIIYKAAQMRGHPRTQAEVCEVVGISEVTLRGLLRYLNSLMKMLGEATEN